MALYRYKGINEVGKIRQGRISAANEVDLEKRVEDMGLELISFKEASAGRSLFGNKKITRQELINFCLHMEQMHSVGVPIMQGLDDLRDSIENPHFREVVSTMIVSIEGGKTLSESMNEFPWVFDEIFVSLIRVGEHSGELSKVLQNIIESLKWQDEMAAQTRKALKYPIFVGTIVIGVVFFLMLYLVPQMIDFISNMGHTIPIHTRALLIVSNFFTDYWYLLISVPVVSAVLVKYLIKTQPGVRYYFDSMVLDLWLVGPIVRKIILSRFANYFALLYSSGVTVLNSMEISEAIAGNKKISQALYEARHQIADGVKMSDSMENARLFPPLVVRMIKMGESTGGLDTALLNVSYFYNRDVKESIEKLQSLIEPVMTVALGVILLWVMVSVLGPVYDIISKV